MAVTPLGRGRRALFRPPRFDQGTVQNLKGLIEAGAFRPLVDRRYPLERIVEAYR